MTTLTQTKLNIPTVDVSELSPLPLLENAYPGPRPGLKVKAEETDELFTDFGQVRAHFPIARKSIPVNLPATDWTASFWKTIFASDICTGTRRQTLVAV